MRVFVGVIIVLTMVFFGAVSVAFGAGEPPLLVDAGGDWCDVTHTKPRPPRALKGFDQAKPGEIDQRTIS